MVTTSASVEVAHYRKNSPTFALKSLLAGGFAGCIAKTVIGPFDRVKILFQVNSPAVSSYAGSISGVFKTLTFIYQRDGIIGLYRGHSAMLVRIFPYAGINYMSYEQYKRILMPNEPSSYSPFRKLLAGSIAGATAVFFTYPMDIMRARLAYYISTQTEGHILQHGQKIPIPLDSSHQLLWRRVLFGNSESLFPKASRPGWVSTFKKLLFGNATKHPIRNLYHGFLPTFLGIIPYSGVSFFTFETTKSFALHHYLQYKGKTLNPQDLPVGIKFLCGLLAGLCGQTCSYPFDVIRRRMQLDSLASHLPTYISIRQAFTHVLRTQGYSGLFRGLSINYLKVAPATAVSFVTYEYLKKQLDIQ